MEIVSQAFFGLAVIGGIAITILFYYHRQSPAIWTTCATVACVAIAVCCLWQDKVWKVQDAQRQAQLASAPSEAELVKPSAESLSAPVPQSSTKGEIMSDEKPKEPRSSQKANNTAGNVYQSGRDTHVYNAPPPSPPKSEYELTTSDRIVMVKLLAPYAGQIISLVKWTDYPEILIYAQQIEQVFAAAGWQIHYVHIGGKARYYGLILGVSDTQHLSAAANAILLAFGKIGVRVPVESINNVSPYRAEGVIALAIGAQP